MRSPYKYVMITQRAQNLRLRYQSNTEYREEVRKYQRDYRRARYAVDPDYRAATRAATKAYEERLNADPVRKEAHLVKARAYRKKRYATNPEYRERCKAYNRHRYATSTKYREQVSKRNQAYRAKHRK